MEFYLNFTISPVEDRFLAASTFQSTILGFTHADE